MNYFFGSKKKLPNKGDFFEFTYGDGHTTKGYILDVLSDNKVTTKTVYNVFGGIDDNTFDIADIKIITDPETINEIKDEFIKQSKNKGNDRNTEFISVPEFVHRGGRRRKQSTIKSYKKKRNNRFRSFTRYSK